MILRGPPAPPARRPTLVAALADVGGHPSGVTFLDLRERETCLRWEVVADRAARAASALAGRGIRPGDRVALVLRTGPGFLDAFFGAWRAGAVPVPLYPPVRLGRMEEWVSATARMIALSGARAVVSSGATRRLAGGAVAAARPALGLVEADDLLGSTRLGLDPAPGDLGLVQFSSGSTVDPKPVALSHRALAAQIDALVAATSPGPDDVLVSWLPLYHDMGLLGGLLGAMSYPGPLVLIPPEHFLTRPSLWLRAIARHRGTISAAPSFAYAYAADRIRDEDLAGLSLASWRLALDGAEAVSGEAMRRFTARFRPHGFAARALVPVYGLSEAALAVTFAARGGGPGGCRVDPVRLAREGLVAPGRREVVSVGTPLPGVEVAVRGERGEELPEGRLGTIHVRGPSLMDGYLGDPEATARALAGGWLDTGDLGFVLDGQLHVHGRAKDVVVVRGANHAPEEFEAALAGLPGLRAGCAVAVGTPAGDGGEGVLLLAERGREADEADAALARRARAAVLERTGIEPAAVRILAPGTLPRTSSGKLRRGEARRRLEAGALAPPRRVTAIGLALDVARGALAAVRARRRGSP
ncbi:MAG TPA: AMP-binding protein [Anaeromyxobacteraceae bacterium]|nr:AMP-binding protein [Anaeromyxobacteraceae bacterium]